MEYEDIVELCSCEVYPGYDHKANDLLRQGWELLATSIIQPGGDGRATIVYILGMRQGDPGDSGSKQ